MVIFGWLRRFTVLGAKLDECASCGQVCEHVVGRKTHWVHVFWIPAVFLFFQHGMVCSSCGAWTGIRWRAVRQAMRTGVLPLDRPRPTGPALLAEAAASEGQPPPNATQLFDAFSVNPKRGFWDLYLKAWPAAVVAFVALSVVIGSMRPANAAPSSIAGAHHCWAATDGSINGCRMTDGSLVGDEVGTETTCFFVEPLDERTRMNCTP